MLLTLETWAARSFEKPPGLSTLRQWAASGQIVPAPVKVGRQWMVDESAKYRALVCSDLPELSERARRILDVA